jgi:hypothetical protein
VELLRYRLHSVDKIEDWTNARGISQLELLRLFVAFFLSPKPCRQIRVLSRLPEPFPAVENLNFFSSVARGDAFPKSANHRSGVLLAKDPRAIIIADAVKDVVYQPCQLLALSFHLFDLRTPSPVLFLILMELCRIKLCDRHRWRT